MDNTQKNLDGELFEKLIVGGAVNLKAHLQTVNDLNVFPIPDGDTGDNMYSTLGGGVEDLKAVKENSLRRKASALASGMLLHARGNSGVILSQLFAGMAEGLDVETADVKTFGNALKMGVKQAYTAVSKPVEGTILTVAREAAEYACDKIDEDSTVYSLIGDYFSEMRKSLERTPELLDVLKEAGVIDSGGAGLLYIAEGMKNVAEGVEQTDSGEVTFGACKELDFSAFNENSEMKYGYCTEMLVQLLNSKGGVSAFSLDTLIAFLESVGDSVVAFVTGTIVKLHVHTMTPYKVLEYCHQFGEFLTVKIENMTLQHNGKAVEKRELLPKAEKKRAHKKFALVTVASGKGLIDTFYEFGADEVIDGGQGKNPSIERFIQAFDDVDADHVFVLPNNGNIVMAAKQAAQMYEKSEIIVIETKNVGQAYSVLSMLDYGEDDAQTIAARMRADMQDVVTGMVTEAVRTTTVDGVAIEKGEYIAFTDHTMLAAAKTNVQAFTALAEKLELQDRGYAIAVYGKDVTAEEKQAAAAFIAEQYPDIEFYGLDGGQEIYDFILIVE